MAYKTIWDNNLIFPYEKRIEIIDSTIWPPDLIQFRYRVSENFFIENKDLFSIDSFKIREITEIIKKDRNANGAILGSMSPDSLKIILNDLKSLSCYGYLFFHARSRNGSVLKVGSQFCIRYNSLYREHMLTNSNPEINWIAVFKVPEEAGDEFNPNNSALAGKFSTYYLYNKHEQQRVSDTIEIDTGFTYFLGGNEEIDIYKSCLEIRFWIRPVILSPIQVIIRRLRKILCIYLVLSECR